MRSCFYIFIFVSFFAQAYTLDGSITGSDIKFKNVQIDSSGAGIVVAWQPAKLLFPVSKWSPGFRANNNSIVLKGPTGEEVNISDAIKIIGLEYKTNISSSDKNSHLPVSTCDSSGEVGSDTAYVVSNSGSSECISEYIYDSENKMPFYFTRPILKIDNDKILSAFSALTEKKEGYYVTSTPVNFFYAFEQKNGVKSWRNLTELLTISFYYSANEITDIRIEDPSIHKMKTIAYNRDRIRGSTKFNVIAKGHFNDGLRLELVKTNKYFLSTDNNGYTIPYNISCPNCVDPVLVRSGKIVGSGVTNILVNDDEIRFPINVDFDVKKDEIPIGDYYGQFTIMFSPDI